MQRPITRTIGMILLALVFSACGIGVGNVTSTPTLYPFITATPQISTAPPQQNTADTTAPTLFPSDATPLEQPTGLAPEVAGPGTAAITATFRPGVGCRYQPVGIFATVYQSDPGLPPSLGCAAGQTSGERSHLWPVTIDFQQFERGYMLWVSNLGWVKGKAIFVMLDDQTLSQYEDTFDASSDPSSGSAVPPAGFYEPLDALGKVWRSQPGLSTRIGFARSPAVHVETQMQVFEFGRMIDVPSAGQVIVLKQGQPGSWSLHTEN